VLAAYTLALVLAGGFVWWVASLRGLPDIGEPFDVRAHELVRVPGSRNAFVVYREAARRFREVDAARYMAYGRFWSETDWARAIPALREWALENRPALETWLPGTERPEAVKLQPKDWRVDSRLWPEQPLQAIVQLALLEGSRRERAGDLAGAWTMYRAALRCSRHVGMHGPLMAREIGLGFLRPTRRHIRRWIRAPGLTPDLLREAREDVETCIAMTPPASVTVRTEYFALDAALAQPERWGRYGLHDPSVWYSSNPWALRMAHVVRREPERSRRILRLLIAGILGQCDRPPALRPSTVDDAYPIYTHDSSTPRSVRAVRPERLQAALEESILRGLFPALGPFLLHCQQETDALRGLRVEMAARHYALERGAPPGNYGALVGTYLRALPEGVSSDDPVAPGLGGARP
jgi:hypothetical protein